MSRVELAYEERGTGQPLVLRDGGARGTGQLADQMLPALLGRTSLDSRPEAVDRVREWAGAAPPAAVVWASRAMAARKPATSAPWRTRRPSAPG